MTTTTLFRINHCPLPVRISTLATLALEATARSECHPTSLQECLPPTAVLTHSGINHIHFLRILWAWASTGLTPSTLDHTIIRVLETHLTIACWPRTLTCLASISGKALLKTSVRFPHRMLARYLILTWHLILSPEIIQILPLR